MVNFMLTLNKLVMIIKSFSASLLLSFSVTNYITLFDLFKILKCTVGFSWNKKVVRTGDSRQCIFCQLVMWDSQPNHVPIKM